MSEEAHKEDSTRKRYHHGARRRTEVGVLVGYCARCEHWILDKDWYDHKLYAHSLFRR